MAGSWLTRPILCFLFVFFAACFLAALAAGAANNVDKRRRAS
jgi:hypothetical protein